MKQSAWQEQSSPGFFVYAGASRPVRREVSELGA
jgi:hypothetical protein